MALWDQKCVPINSGTPPLTDRTIHTLLLEIPKWSLKGNTILREFLFNDFREAIDFVNSAVNIINEQDHHPDIYVSYNKVQLIFTTHRIKSLSLNDFIVAAKIDRMIGH
ncbi:MAG TPA: 4a-hydroxytetrahydrobiopterin dehydratase [Nitrospirota bacterium]|nr:4a-hydroxytetrahydrobiopterin dehydratase [Nitrospirota bacterium]